MKRLLLPLLAALALPTAVLAGKIYTPYFKVLSDAFSDEKYMVIAFPSNEKKDTYLQIYCWPDNKYKRRFRGRLTMHQVRDDIGVRLRWDKEEPESQTWNSNGELDELYLGRGSFENTRMYIPKFRKHSKLTLQYRTYIDGTHTVTFDLDPIKPLFAQAEDEGCVWEDK